MHGTNCSVITEVGRLRENVRGRVVITTEAVDLVTLTFYTGTHTEQVVMSGEHWDAFAKAVAAADKAVKRARLNADRANRQRALEADTAREAVA